MEASTSPVVVEDLINQVVSTKVASEDDLFPVKKPNIVSTILSECRK